MSTVIGGSSPSITFSDSTTQSTAFTGLNSSASPYTTSLGYQAANSTTGVNNTAIGYQAGYSNVTGAENTFIGNKAGTATTSGYNVAVGSQAMLTNTSGTGVAIGQNALYSQTSGTNNNALGGGTLFNNTTGSSNTGIGHNALYANTTGNNNTGIGYQAGNVITTGGGNTSIGQSAHNALTTGSNNVAIGAGAGQSITTGSQTIYMGYNAYASSSSVVNEIVISTYLAGGKGSQTAFLFANSSAGAGGSYYNGANSATWNITSDQRLKKNIVTNTDGLDKITAIQVRNFEYCLPEEVSLPLKPTDAVVKSGVQLGVIAQELQAVLPDCVSTESTGVMSVNSESVMWHLVTAVQQLNTIVNTQATTIATMQAQITALNTKVGI
jgi:hypothetical protein